jgi:hypothetical protein
MKCQAELVEAGEITEYFFSNSPIFDKFRLSIFKFVASCFQYNIIKDPKKHSVKTTPSIDSK